jgi:hypothetical protein
MYQLVLQKTAIYNETHHYVEMDRTRCEADFDLLRKSHQADYPGDVSLPMVEFSRLYVERG